MFLGYPLQVADYTLFHYAFWLSMGYCLSVAPGTQPESCFLHFCPPPWPHIASLIKHHREAELLTLPKTYSTLPEPTSRNCNNNFWEIYFTCSFTLVWIAILCINKNLHLLMASCIDLGYLILKYCSALKHVSVTFIQKVEEYLDIKLYMHIA